MEGQGIDAAVRLQAARWRGPSLLALTVLAVLGFSLWLSRRHTDAGPTGVVREFAVFDSYARITLWTDTAVADLALRECALRLAELHRTLNRWEPDSEAARLNQQAAAQPFVCSPVLWDVLQAARRAYRQTEGAFDVSVGPVMAVWGLHRKRDTLPADAEIQEALARVGLARVHFDDAEHSVRFTVDGMSLDFGGIAKGYALDAVIGILARHRIERALVDLGGNVACTLLPPPGRASFFIGIRNPYELKALLGRLPVLGRAVSTSGNYERRIVIQGQEIGHIVDPRTGRPVSGPAGVTALATSGTDSDVFSTAVYVAGRPLAEALAASTPGTGFVLVSGPPEAPRLEVLGDVTLLDAVGHEDPVQATPNP